MINFDLLEYSLDLPVKVESSLVHKVVQPLVIEQPLHFREHCLYRVELRAVRHVEYRRNAQIQIMLLHLF